MPGRGVDQVLPHPSDPTLRERAVDDARTYVALAEDANGLIPHPVGPDWPWGQALPILDRTGTDLRLINLESCVTDDGHFAPGKCVHYRMSPGNLSVLTTGRVDICSLANNHVLDFGHRGLTDTLNALDAAGLSGVGAGRTADEAQRPAVLPVRGGHRVVVSAWGMESSGIPRHWAAAPDRPGVALVPDLSQRSAARIATRAGEPKRAGDVTIVSLHWGSNWGYRVEPSQRRFAHRLIDLGVDLVHGHSSHHPRPIEVYQGRLILYGCGDLINDYEGIRGCEAYRDDLRLLYVASIDPGSGELTGLRIVPLQSRRLRLERASVVDTEWIRTTLERISHPYGAHVHHGAGGTLVLTLPRRSSPRSDRRCSPGDGEPDQPR